MKFWKPFLLVVWVVVVFLVLIFYIIPQEEAMDNGLIEKLQKENEQLSKQNLTLDLEIEKLKEQADSLSVNIATSKQTIHNLETELNEKIIRINAMSALELYEYFSKFRTDSTQLRQ